MNDERIILTGAFGTGKTTLLEHLRALGFRTIEEPARRVLAQQRAFGGSALSQRDARRFVDLMLSTATDDYRCTGPAAAPIFFDRGIPDALAYAALFGFNLPVGELAAREHRYADRVFFAPAWEEIYTTDEERTVSFQEASRFGATVRAVYERLGYMLIDLPLLPVAERASFVLTFL
jgi:predicted ATPase